MKSKNSTERHVAKLEVYDINKIYVVEFEVLFSHGASR